MMLRRFQRKFSISAPRLAVRPHVPWYVRWALVVPFVLGAAALVWWAYDSGLQFAGYHREQAEDELSSLRRKLDLLQTENATLNSKMVEFQRQAQMEHATNQELAKQLKVLNDEKDHLNEDLAFFQNLTTQAGNHQAKLSINRLKVEHDTLPGEYHCSMLLVQSGRRAKEFKGSLQLVANVLHNGVRSVLVFPQEKSVEAELYKVDFKYYQRVERSFQLPQGATLESLEVRIYERGMSEPKIKQDVGLILK